ncbi:hypothetical protein UlMin_037718 [Ulmus minor]
MQEDQMTVPYLFRCPITLDLFKDPVTLCTGQTYDRSSIEKWLAAGNLTCPVTMQKLQDPTMVPNHTLRQLIDRWLQMGPQFDPDCLARIDSLTVLKNGLQSHEATIETKLQAIEKIRVLSEESSSRPCLVQLGFFALLLEQVFGRVEAKLSQNCIKFAEEALFCVLNLLPLAELESLNILEEESKLAALLVLFKDGTNLVKMKLCHLIEATSSSSETKELCAKLGKTSQLLHEIAHFVHQNSEDSDAGIRAIWALSSSEQNLESFVHQGMVDGLISYILDTEGREKSLAPLAMAALERLLALESAKLALISNPYGINALVKKVFRVSDDHEGSESAVNSLMIICYDSLQAREEAIGDGVLTQLLLLLQSQCSFRTKTKARMLLKLLRSKRVEDSKHV